MEEFGIQKDSEALRSQVLHEEKRLRIKRRCLMDLPLSGREHWRFEVPDFMKEKILPESLLRDDDTFYETVKYRVEEAFGEQRTETDCSIAPENFEPFAFPVTMRRLRSCLSDLTTRGLHRLALIVSGGSARGLRTRQSMQKVVKESLPDLLRKHRNIECTCELCRQIYQLLCDPLSARRNNSMFLVPTTRYVKAAVTKILRRLNGLPPSVLYAMYKTLQGESVKASPTSGLCRDELMKLVRKMSMKMLSQLQVKKVLEEPLAKAITIADMYLKLTSGAQSFSWPNFFRVSPEVRSLQDDIVKAVWLLRTKEFRNKFYNSHELKKLLVFFEHCSGESSKCIGPIKVSEILIQYLFEFSNDIPKSILQGVALINKKSQMIPCMRFSKDKLEEEVECILSLSAQTKQISMDLLPDNEYDKGFADAYVEELRESDDESGDESGDLYYSNNLQAEGSDTEHVLEGFGESTAVDFGQCPVPSGESSVPSVATISGLFTPKSEPVHYYGVNSASPWYTDSKFTERTSMDIDGGCTSDFCSHKVATDHTSMPFNVGFSAKCPNRCNVKNDALEEQIQCPGENLSSGNLYLSIQDACDDTSLVAYNLVGFMLEEFAQEEGVELDDRERFYLKGDQSENLSVGGETKPNAFEDIKLSTLHRAVQRFMPSPKISMIEKVEQIWA